MSSNGMTVVLAFIAIGHFMMHTRYRATHSAIIKADSYSAFTTALRWDQPTGSA